MNHIKELDRVFALQSVTYKECHGRSYAQRMHTLNQIDQCIRDQYEDIIKALQEDFGTRDYDMAFLGDIYPVLDHVRHVRKHLKAWLPDERQSDGWLGLLGQKSYIRNEPLGVVGILAPFNAPISLAFDPAIDAIAAGNTTVLRFPESMPKTGALISALAKQYFSEDVIAICTGDIETAKHFSTLAWDKLVFTGGSEVAKHIMAAAASNLTPVLLELGGKSPVVVLPDADLALLAKKVAKVMLLNGGQVCIRGDYVLVPEAHLTHFVELVKDAIEVSYPSLQTNPQYTTLVGDGAYDRIQSYLQELKTLNAKVISVVPRDEALPDAKTRKIPPTLVIDPPQSTKVCQEEVFGPLLPIIPYQSVEHAINHINQGEKPLALYIFGKSTDHINAVIARTSSGGVTVNDFLLHAGSHTMGFGGVGYSGMGRYKGGKVGFRAFSNQKAIVQQGLFGKFSHNFIPPLTDRERRILFKGVGITK